MAKSARYYQRLIKRMECLNFSMLNILVLVYYHTAHLFRGCLSELRMSWVQMKVSHLKYGFSAHTSLPIQPPGPGWNYAQRSKFSSAQLNPQTHSIPLAWQIELPQTFRRALGDHNRTHSNSSPQTTNKCLINKSTSKKWQAQAHRSGALTGTGSGGDGRVVLTWSSWWGSRGASCRAPGTGRAA